MKFRVAVIRGNRRLTVREIADEVGINIASFPQNVY
jgi:AcrR family transcriptional regulator